MGETKRLVISSGDGSLPIWFTEVLCRQKKKELVLLLDGEKAVLENQPEKMEAMYVEENGKKKGAAILCHVISENISFGQLLTINGEPIFADPQALSFLDTNIPGLDVCFTLVVWLPDEKEESIDKSKKLSYLENFILCYQKKIPVIPGLLEMERAWLRITREGISSLVMLTGEFCLGQIPLTVQLDFAPGRFQGTLRAGEKGFPSFFDFVQWVTGGIGLGQSFEWLEEAKNILDASLNSVSFTLDTQTMSVSDYQVETKVKFLGMDLEITYFGAQKLLRGRTWDQKPLELGAFIERLLGDTNLPEGLNQVKLTGCLLNIWTEKKQLEITASAEGRVNLASFSLTQVSIFLKLSQEEQQKKDSGESGKTGGKNLSFHIKIAGTAELSQAWRVKISLDYIQGGGYTLTGCLVLLKPQPLPEIPFLNQLLPGEIHYKEGAIELAYSKGLLTKGSVEFTTQSPMPTKQPLTPVLKVENLPDKTPKVTKTKIVPEKGPVRQGDGIRYYELRKNVGPAHLERVGLGFSDMALTACLDGSVKLGPVEIQVMGLSVGYDIKNKSFKGGLWGLLISCTTPGFSLMGGIYRDLPRAGIRMSFSGIVKLQLAKWGLQAVASYAVMEDGTISFFVFLNCALLLPLFPGFSITGLMGGLGINRRFVIPTAQELEDYPLFAMGKNQSGMQVLSGLEQRKSLEPAAGEYWGAIGMEVEACGLVRAKVLLAVLFGKEFQAALLGSMEISFPKGAAKEKSFAYVQILMSAVLRPASGIFWLEAVFGKDSFLFSKDCHIFGQAVCAVWFGSHEHAGDFVVSLGGYHPYYKVPGHYPKVKPIGFSWQVTENISAKGNVYLALTPSCVMAGGKLEFLFTLGNLRAWFNAWANFFIGWHPFFFDGEIGVEIGISYSFNLLSCHKTISLSMGASLHLWGPPLGGELHVKVLFLSFQIAFGNDRNMENPYLSWDEFRKTLLTGEKLHSINALSGVTPQQKEEEPWICREGYFSMAFDTKVPQGEIDIRPMGLTGVESHWEIEITGPEQQVKSPTEWGFVLREEKKNLPGALWGRPACGTPDSGLIKGLTTGYVIEAQKPVLGGELQILNYRDALVKCLNLDNPLFTREALRTPVICGETSGETLRRLREIDGEEKQNRRRELCGCLGAYYNGPAGVFFEVNSQREQLFQDSPRITKRR